MRTYQLRLGNPMGLGVGVENWDFLKIAAIVRELFSRGPDWKLCFFDSFVKPGFSIQDSGALSQ